MLSSPTYATKLFTSDCKFECCLSRSSANVRKKSASVLLLTGVLGCAISGIRGWGLAGIKVGVSFRTYSDATAISKLIQYVLHRRHRRTAPPLCTTSRNIRRTCTAALERTSAAVVTPLAATIELSEAAKLVCIVGAVASGKTSTAG